MLKLLDNFYVRLVVNMLFVLFQPSYWIQVRKTSFEWDKELWKSLRTRKFNVVDYYYIMFENSNKYVWTRNFPYGSACIADYSGGFNLLRRSVLPLSITRYLLKRKVDDMIVKKIKVDSNFFTTL